MAWTDLTTEQQKEFLQIFATNGVTEAQGIEMYNEQNP